MNGLSHRRRSTHAATDSEVQTDATAEDAAAFHPDDVDARTVARMSREHEAAGASASELAYGTAVPPRHKQLKSSHDGGFTGFGAELNPFVYTDPHEKHAGLDPKVERLGAQHVRIFVPLNVISSGLLGKAGIDFDQQNIDHLTAALVEHPGDADLTARLAAAKKRYAQDQSYVHSFEQTVALAGKHSTINLTFSGAVGNPTRIDQFAKVVEHYTKQGYKLQVTLQNEPNGPDTGKGFRGRFDQAIIAGDRAAADAAAMEYVEAYHRLDDDLAQVQVRDKVAIVGGDMVAHHREEFFETIHRLHLGEHVDSYSFHVYWGTGKGNTFKDKLAELEKIKAQADKYADGKPLQITEFGKKRDGSHAAEKGENAAFQQGLFALTAVNLGYTGLVKWDAYYGGEHHEGDGKGDAGEFYMIGKPGAAGKPGYQTDETYRLMRMFTHATEPGWHVHGANHGDQAAETRFASEDGHGGAVLAMSRTGHGIATTTLPKGRRLHVTVWNQNGKGELHTHAIAAGDRPIVHCPKDGAVSVSTKPFSVG